MPVSIERRRATSGRDRRTQCEAAPPRGFSLGTCSAEIGIDGRDGIHIKGTMCATVDSAVGKG